MSDQEPLPYHVQDLLVKVRQYIAGTIEESGGCDHSVGICDCYGQNLVASIDRELFRRLGLDLVGAFFHAEPTHTWEHREPGLKWAKDAERIIAQQIVEKLDALATDCD